MRIKGNFMKRMRRDNIFRRTSRILGGNEGASLVLVAVLATIVLTAVIVLRIATNSFMASANRQLNQDQAYELAASLGSSIDVLINDGEIDLDNINSDTTLYSEDKFVNLPNSSVKAKIIVNPKVKKLEVTAIVGKAQYVYTKEYLP